MNSETKIKTNRQKFSTFKNLFPVVVVVTMRIMHKIEKKQILTSTCALNTSLDLRDIHRGQIERTHFQCLLFLNYSCQYLWTWTFILFAEMFVCLFWFLINKQTLLRASAFKKYELSNWKAFQTCDGRHIG